MKASSLRIACLALWVAGLAACRPEPPPTDEPPEPQAEQATALRDAMQRPIEQATAAEDAASDAAAAQRAEIEAATQ